MGKSLVIVESPAKAKTINRYLGNDFIVKSSVGHIRDLPISGNGAKSDPKKRAQEAAKTRKMAPEKKAAYKKEKAHKQLVARMGIDPGEGWQAQYEILPGKEKVVSELRKLARDADEIYLATDLDREGEAIAWHLREAIGGDERRYRRVVFNEITKKAIQEAFADPGDINMDMVNAQQARRFLDRVVGFMVSPLLWAKIARGLSAGRVQSVAVKLIVEREREIRAFVPEEYWEVYANLAEGPSDSKDGNPVKFQVTKQAGKNFRPVNRSQTDIALATLEGASFIVKSREDRPTQSKPTAPYITSTLQQAASTRLGYGVKKTMMMAQRLYEAGYITYMRTDSTNLSAEAVAQCRELISSEFGNKYLLDSPRIYSSKEGAQEAHEAIRPSDVSVKATSLAGMERDAERLYELIWRQFVACQMPNAEYTSTTALVGAEDLELRVNGRILRFDGFTRIQPPAGRKEDEVPLPDYKVDQKLALVELLPSQHFTKPLPRYGEASLVKELEKRGIGRPSTYASIITTIQDRGYVTLESKRFHAEKIGELVTGRLMESFESLMNYGFTAELEESLDKVSDGSVDWKNLLDTFYSDFSEKLDAAGQTENGMRPNEPSITDIDCPQCGRMMNIRTASTGVFLGCSGYALPPKERCKSTINLVPGDEVASVNGDEEEESRILRAKKRCAKCGSAMDSYLIDTTRKLHLCGNNPDCTGFEVEAGEFKIKGYDGPVLECDKCGAEMQLKTGRFGKYFGCTSDDCKNTRKLLRNGEAAPPKMDPVPMPELVCEKVDDTYLLRDGAAGIFLAASQFPRNRETRAPYVDELIPHQNEIDPRYAFLMRAPVEDPDGRRSLVKFGRKTKEHYVMTELEKGKPSGWRADYLEGNWVEEYKKKTTKKKVKKKAKKKSTATG
ncbi:MAG: DNA topoisomerase I subunit omega [Gammaproteobacteria bacterium]|jgi:DNA topoisomerase-1|nr:DNA topoisomerase I subunit omega [Gammaproteobacteria bacterium]|tara:strand:- start:8752 stop:11454 length:2703 start_codon:yes stop_codon:yes gene_type:complete